MVPAGTGTPFNCHKSCCQGAERGAGNGLNVSQRVHHSIIATTITWTWINVASALVERMSALHPVARSEVLFYQHLGLPTPSLGLFTIFVSESKVGWFVSMSRTCTLNWLHVLNPGQVAWPAASSLIRDFPSQKKTTAGPVQHVLYQNFAEVSENHKTAWGFSKFPCGKHHGLPI